MTEKPPICIAVLAHNEEERIAACLNSLPLGDAQVAIHVIVNGSTDATAAIAGGVAAAARNVRAHIYSEGGKARSWNRFLFDDLKSFHETHIFVDGDAEIMRGSVAALHDALGSNPHANAAAGLPMNGRGVESYRRAMRAESGLFGDLYALRGDFLGLVGAEGHGAARKTAGSKTAATVAEESQRNKNERPSKIHRQRLYSQASGNRLWR